MRGIVSGHASGDLRESFYHLLDDLRRGAAAFDDERVRRLTGRLWNCTDVMPSDACADADEAPGTSVAQAARRLRRYASAR
jgi:hypothetical protein